jgi:thiamine-phosphate pyrophosphorylase
MNDEADQGPSLEERLERLREGLKFVAQTARPGLTESLKLTRGALHTLDSAVAGGLRRLGDRRPIGGLYVIVDPEHCRGRDPLIVASQALDGGAAMIQWRDKIRDKGDQLPVVLALRDLCARYLAYFIVNDHVDLALASGADGVHLGQHDLSVDAVRKLVSADFLVGCSTNSADEARQAERDGADYVAVGSVFPTASKANIRLASPATVREVSDAVAVPVVAIGGITAQNLDEVINAGARGAAVIGAVCEADDIRGAARTLSKRFETALGGK